MERRECVFGKCAKWNLEFILECGQIDTLYYVTWVVLVISCWFHLGGPQSM